MKPEDRAILKEKIIEQLEIARKKVAAFEEMSKPISPENAIGRVSRMDAINNKGVSDAAKRNAQRQLSSLETALTKVDKSEFGTCSNCKKMIQPARLMFMPESPLGTQKK